MTKKELKFCIVAIAMSFILGGIMRLGGKTVDRLWPDPPMEITTTHKFTPEIPGRSETPEDL